MRISMTMAIGITQYDSNIIITIGIKLSISNIKTAYTYSYY